MRNLPRYEPSASTTAEIPEIAAWSTGRPVSAARIWLRATCWALRPDRRYDRLFVLTTQTEHWFIEQGFAEASRNDLPGEKQSLYNLQRNSKVFIKALGAG